MYAAPTLANAPESILGARASGFVRTEFVMLAAQRPGRAVIFARHFAERHDFIRRRDGLRAIIGNRQHELQTRWRDTDHHRPGC